MTAQIIATGLDEFARFFESVPDLANEAAFFAVNDTSRDTVPLLKRTMRKQINFPSKYLNAERLSIRRKATRSRLEATISGRDRPTSLARFAEGATPENSRKAPIIVHVKPGKKKVLNKPSSKTKAFLVRLRNNNIGLAVRLPKGETLSNSEGAIPLTRGKRPDENVYLLYGPSVDQVLQGVIPDSTDEITRMLQSNFLRQFTRLSRG